MQNRSISRTRRDNILFSPHSPATDYRAATCNCSQLPRFRCRSAFRPTRCLCTTRHTLALLWSHLVMPCPADLTDQSRARHTNIMGCSISRATAGVVEATKTDAIRIAAKPVNSRPLEPRIWSVVSEAPSDSHSPRPERVCLSCTCGCAVASLLCMNHLHRTRCRGLVAMQRSLRPHGSLRPHRRRRRRAPAVVKTPSMEKEKA